MKTLKFIIIGIIFFSIIHYSVPLNNGENDVLIEMYNEWYYILGWTLPVSNACVNWTGIVCNVEKNVEQMS